MPAIRTLARPAIFGVTLCAALLSGQKKPPAPAAQPALQEFPVILRQSLTSGKTPVGTKVEATLTLATLIGGKVAPQGAIFSGTVIESTTKSAANPSRLAVRMDALRWKNGSTPINAYLTGWYYPVSTARPENSADARPFGANGEGKRTWAGYNPSPTDQVLFPGRSQAQPGDPASAAASNPSEHRVAMKNVETVRENDLAIALTSTRSNIKLDKETTYLLAASSPATTPATEK